MAFFHTVGRLALLLVLRTVRLIISGRSQGNDQGTIGTLGGTRARACGGVCGCDSS
jgi:hypothetical protein